MEVIISKSQQVVGSSPRFRRIFTVLRLAVKTGKLGAPDYFCTPTRNFFSKVYFKSIKKISAQECQVLREKSLKECSTMPNFNRAKTIFEFSF